jgi:Tfp pilus assembly protein PilE
MFKSNRSGFTLIQLLVVLVFFAIIGSVVYGYGQKFFSRSEHVGVVKNVASMTPNAVIGHVSQGYYSFSIDMECEGSEIVSFSSEDRKFSTVNKGDSIRVVTFTYPFWSLDKAGTLYGGRLIKKYKLGQ